MEELTTNGYTEISNIECGIYKLFEKGIKRIAVNSKTNKIILKYEVDN